MSDKWSCPYCPQWQPIETAPKDKMLLAFWPGWGSVIVAYDDRMWQSVPHSPDLFHDAVVDGCQPTHWMHLPEEPKNVD